MGNRCDQPKHRGTKKDTADDLGDDTRLAHPGQREVEEAGEDDDDASLQAS